MWIIRGLVALAAGMAVMPAAAQDLTSVYKGQQLKLIISSPPGGGYDAYARTIARHMGSYLPGNPTIIAQNMAGAGGVKAANYLYTVAPKDGLTIGNLQNTVPFEPMYENKQATFDTAKFNWLGSPSKEVAMLTVWHTVPVNSVEEAVTKDHTFILGASGVNSTPAFYARVLKAVFGIKVKLIVGYPGQTESLLAMEKGENEGYASVFWSSIKSTKPDWIRDKQIKFLVQMALEPHPELKDVPFALDMIKDPADKQLMELASAQLAIGRPMVAPPGVAPERVALLRKSLDATYKDKAFLAECDKQRLECDTPVSGEEMQNILKRMYASPEPVVARLRVIYEGKEGAN
jgi:tripartite-type tricarboxylate transporter receptor subunit TctC